MAPTRTSPQPQETAFDPQTGRFSERYIQDAFHRYLKSSLTQAKMERLLDNDVLSSAEADLMISGPALCLYFAALRCTTNPPSVPLPRSRTSSKASRSASPQPELQLSEDNCPPTFISFLRVWSHAVPRIQSLSPELQHDLARVICALPPLSLSPHKSTTTDDDGLARVDGIAADLRAMAIEISQRRSFQDRFNSDLQAALDSGVGPANSSSHGSTTGSNGNGNLTASDRKLRASFVPPPVYQPAPPSSGIPGPSPPNNNNNNSAQRPPLSTIDRTSSTSSAPPRSPANSFFFTNNNTNTTSTPHPNQSHHLPSPHSPPPPPPQQQQPPVELLIIRETLYASLASVLESHHSLHTLLSTDPPRAYFASVAFAILNVVSTCLSLPSRSEGAGREQQRRRQQREGEKEVEEDEATITGVLGTPLTLSTCPPELKPFFAELVGIGREVRDVEREDTEVAVRFAEGDSQTGEEMEMIPRMDEVRLMLEEGVGAGGGGGRGMRRKRSVRGRTVSLVNRINALSLGLTRLKAFRERQDEAFGILAAVVGGGK